MTPRNPILIRFSRGTGWEGAVVRWATWCWAAHVGFKLPDGRVLDATPEFGVATRIAADDPTTRYFLPHAEQTQVRNAVAYAAQQIGKPYDWTALIGMAVRRDWHKPDKWFCSELVEAAMYEAGCELLDDDNHVDRITPRDLLLSPRMKPYQLMAPPDPHSAAFPG
jgi:uncharacterized protein YycO